MKPLLIFLCYFFLTPMASAQTIVKNAIVVNGLQVGEKYTREQFVQALGTPTKIQEPDKFDDFLNCYIYYYGEDLFYWIDGEFYGFEFRTSAFLVNGLLRVGESVSKIDLLGGFKEDDKTFGTLLVYWRPTTEGLYQWLSLESYYNTNNIITSILCFIQDL